MANLPLFSQAKNSFPSLRLAPKTVVINDMVAELKDRENRNVIVFRLEPSKSAQNNDKAWEAANDAIDASFYDTVS